MYQRKTLRRLPPTARKLAKMANALELEVRRLHALIPIVKVHEEVHSFATTRRTIRPETELPMEGCAAHGEHFDPSCGDCADSFFNRGVDALTASVTRATPWIGRPPRGAP